MSIEAAIVIWLKADPDLAVLTVGRIYPVYIPQAMVGDAIVYQEIAGEEEVTCDGYVGMVEGRFQLTCWSATHAGAVRLREALVTALKAFAPGTWSGTRIETVRIEGRGEIQALSEAEEQIRFGKWVDVTFAYVE